MGDTQQGRAPSVGQNGALPVNARLRFDPTMMASTISKAVSLPKVRLPATRTKQDAVSQHQTARMHICHQAMSAELGPIRCWMTERSITPEE
jgi:hypothetical protein